MISDAEIIRIKSHAKTMNAHCNASGDYIPQDYYLGVIDALNELQQRRTAQHERRWRKISEEGWPIRGEAVQFTDGERVISFNEQQIKSEYTPHFRKWDGLLMETHWRPQQTDLPETP